MNVQESKLKLARRIKKHRSLGKVLRESGKTRWLDVGSTKFDEGFECLNLWDPEGMTEEQAKSFHRKNILNFSQNDIDKIGCYDLVRLQHVMEHFSFEDGQKVLEQIERILEPGGYAPPSCVFSVHAHQMGYHPQVKEGCAHRWCYDYEGLKYQVERSDKFHEICELGLLHPLAEIGFIHGRLAEDTCLLARKI